MKKLEGNLTISTTDVDGSLEVPSSDYKGVLDNTPIGGTTDYNELKNKPLINSVTVEDDHDGAYYGLTDLAVFDTFVKAQGQKDIEQDTKIKQNSTDIANLTTNFDNYKVSQEKRDKEQDIALSDYKQVVAKEQEAQDVKIKQNSTDISGVTTGLDNYKKEVQKDQERQDKALEDYKQVVDLKNTQQDTAIQANTNNFVNYYDKTYIDKSQETQDTNIQNNALGLLEKVDEDTYIKDQLAQNQLIEANKQAITATNQTLETYKQETTKGFQDERELSTQEFEEAKNLANTKAVIDDLNVSSKTTMSSYELISRVSCEKTLKGSKITFKPVEGYPITTKVEIVPVHRQIGVNISGWTNVDVTQDNGGTHKVYNQELGKTIYGGFYEFHKGKLTINRKSEEFFGTEDTWKEVKLTNGRRHQFVLEGYLTNTSNDLSKQLCNNYSVPKEVPAPDFNGVWIQDNKLFIGGAIADIYDTLQDWRDYLIMNPLQMVYGLESPEVEEFEPKAINAQAGVNIIYANTGDIEITTKVMPLCEGDVDGVSKEYVDEHDALLQSQIDQKVTQEVGKGLYPTDKAVTDNNYSNLDKLEVSKIKDKANATDVEQALAGKANVSDIKTKLSELENDVPFSTVKSVETMGSNTLTSAKSYTDTKTQGLATSEWVQQELAKKANDVDLPTDVSQLNNDANYQTKEDVDKKFDSLGTVTRLKPNVANYEELIALPAESNQLGDIRTTEDNGQEYIWNETSKGTIDWQEVGIKQDLSNFVKKTDILDSTGTSTDKVMSQNAVTEALKLKANSSDLASKQDKLTSEQLTNLNDIPNKANKSYVDNELKTKANKDYVDEQLKTKASTSYVNEQLDLKANSSDLDKKQNALTSTQLANINDVPNKASTTYVNQELAKKQGTLSKEQLEAIADVKNKANANDVPTNNNQLTNGAGYQTAENVNTIINSKGYQTAAQVKAIKVDNATNADTATNATKFNNYDLESFKTEVIAKVKVNNAVNADKLNNIPANDYAMNIDIANMVEEPTENILNANLALIRGWYKTNGDTSNLPFETPISDKVGFFRVLELNHDSRDVLQIYYCFKKKVLYLRYIAGAQPQDWFVLPSINDKDRTGLLTTYSAKQIEDILASPQYSVMTVQVSPRGSGGYQADKTALEIKQHIDAGGLAVLKHENQIYEYQKYDANDAVFFRVDVSNDKVEEIDIRVQYDKNINVVRTPYGINETKVNELIEAKGYATTKYVDDSIKQAILDSWGGSY